MASISIALSKGRIFDETAPLLARVGIRPRENPETSRKLVIGTNRRDLRLVVAAYAVGENRILRRRLEYASREVYEYVNRVATRYRARKLTSGGGR